MHASTVVRSATASSGVCSTIKNTAANTTNAVLAANAHSIRRPAASTAASPAARGITSTSRPRASLSQHVTCPAGTPDPSTIDRTNGG
jgi:hypothetical protein